MGEVDSRTSTSAEHQVREALDALRSSGMRHAAAIDPLLLDALGVPAGTPVADTREVVARGLLDLAEPWDDELRTTLLLAFGFTRDAPLSPGQRCRALAHAQHISLRTAYRRVDAVMALLTDALLLAPRLRRPLEADVVIVNAHLRVDLAGDEPVIVTERTISARVDGVRSLHERLYFPRHRGPELAVQALSGCRIGSNTAVGDGIWAITFDLPHPLALGERHALAHSVRLPDHASLEPVLGFLPATPSFAATVELRFGERLPARVQQFACRPPIQAIPAESIVPVTPVRRQVITWAHMQPGMCYGVRWS